MSRRSNVPVAAFTGSNYNPAKPLGRGWFFHDFNGKHFVRGQWSIRTGLSRPDELVSASGSAILAISQFRGLGDRLKTTVIQGDGKYVGDDTPEPVWRGI